MSISNKGWFLNGLASSIRRKSSGSSILVEQRIGDATPVLFDDLIFSTVTHYSVDAEPATYAVTGSPATTLRTRALNAESSVGYTVTGFSATLVSSRNIVASSPSYVLTGLPTSFRIERSLVLATTSYALGGVGNSLLFDRKALADSSSYSIAGQQTSLVPSYVAAANNGTMWVTGSDVTLNKTTAYSLVLDTESYTLSGVGSALSVNRSLNSEASLYSIIGGEAELVKEAPITHYSLEASPAAYGFSVVFTYTGFPVTFVLEITGILEAESGSYAFTGSPVEFYKTINRSTDSGSYVIIGNDVSLYLPRLLNAEEGSLVLTGSSAFFSIERFVNGESSTYEIIGIDAGIEVVYSTLPDSYSLTFTDSTLQKNTPLSALPTSYFIAGASTRFDLSVDYSIPAGFDAGLKYDIDTGRFVKILSNKICISL